MGKKEKVGIDGGLKEFRESESDVFLADFTDEKLLEYIKTGFGVDADGKIDLADGALADYAEGEICSAAERLSESESVPGVGVVSLVIMGLAPAVIWGTYRLVFGFLDIFSGFVYRVLGIFVGVICLAAAVGFLAMLIRAVKRRNRRRSAEVGIGNAWRAVSVRRILLERGHEVDGVRLDEQEGRILGLCGNMEPEFLCKHTECNGCGKRDGAV